MQLIDLEIIVGQSVEINLIINIVTAELEWSFIKWRSPLYIYCGDQLLVERFDITNIYINIFDKDVNYRSAHVTKLYITNLYKQDAVSLTRLKFNVGLEIWTSGIKLLFCFRYYFKVHFLLESSLKAWFNHEYTLKWRVAMQKYSLKCKTHAYLITLGLIAIQCGLGNSVFRFWASFLQL